MRIYDVTHSNPVDTNMTNFICTPMLMAGAAPSRVEFDAYLQNGHVTVGIMTDVADTNNPLCFHCRQFPFLHRLHLPRGSQLPH